MIYVLFSWLKAPVQARQPWGRPPVLSPIAQPTDRDIRRILHQRVTAAILQRLSGFEDRQPFPSTARNRLQSPRPPLTTTPRRRALSIIFALHNAERRLSLIPPGERAFGKRPRPSHRGKRHASKMPTIVENEVYPASTTNHPLTRTKTYRPHRRVPNNENTIP